MGCRDMLSNVASTPSSIYHVTLTDRYPHCSVFTVHNSQRRWLAVVSVITTEQSAVTLNNAHCQVFVLMTSWFSSEGSESRTKYRTPWHPGQDPEKKGLSWEIQDGWSPYYDRIQEVAQETTSDVQVSSASRLVQDSCRRFLNPDCRHSSVVSRHTTSPLVWVGSRDPSRCSRVLDTHRKWFQVGFIRFHGC